MGIVHESSHRTHSTVRLIAPADARGKLENATHSHLRPGLMAILYFLT